MQELPEHSLKRGGVVAILFDILYVHKFSYPDRHGMNLNPRKYIV